MNGTGPGSAAPRLAVRSLSAWYGDLQALHDVSLDFPAGEVTAVLGASGSGKTTLLRCLNRMIEAARGGRMRGSVLLDDVDLARQRSVSKVRRHFGVINQKPDPFPRSVRENVAYGPRLHRLARDREELDAHVRRALVLVGAWEELRDALDERATNLSVGQQQRVCIARAIAYRPSVLLLDEPCSALDRAATARVENLVRALRGELTLVLVTHHPAHARNVADHVAMMDRGRLVEAGETGRVLAEPASPVTRSFLESDRIALPGLEEKTG